MKRGKTFWTEQKIADLRRLWAEGLTASQIARKIGAHSRNAVIGKVSRLGLISRKPRESLVVRLSNLAPNTCRYPFGHPDEPGFRFCDKKAEPGRPYCLDHCDIVYQPRTEKEKADRVARKLAGIAVAST